MSISNKIEDLVYSGKVIDDHGNWITIAEKLRKEKIFLSHLERGEILLNGKWTAMSDLPAEASSIHADTIRSSLQGTTVHDETTLDPPEIPEETVYFSTVPSSNDTGHRADPDAKTVTDIPSFASDETVSVSTDSIRDLQSVPLPADTNPDVEFPPETKSMVVEVIPPPETTINLSTEFEETALYNIKVLKDTPTETAAAKSDPATDTTANPPVSSLFDTPPVKPLFPITVAAILIIIAVIFILLTKIPF